MDLTSSNSRKIVQLNTSAAPATEALKKWDGGCMLWGRGPQSGCPLVMENDDNVM